MREPRRGALDPRLNRAFSQHHRHCIKPQRRRRLRRRRPGEREHAHNLDKSQHLIADHVQPIFIPRGEPSRSAFRSFAERAKRAHRRHKRRAGGYARALARVALIVGNYFDDNVRSRSVLALAHLPYTQPSSTIFTCAFKSNVRQRVLERSFVSIWSICVCVCVYDCRNSRAHRVQLHARVHHQQLHVRLTLRMH